MLSKDHSCSYSYCYSYSYIVMDIVIVWATVDVMPKGSLPLSLGCKVMPSTARPRLILHILLSLLSKVHAD